MPLELLPSEFAEAFITLKGKPFSFSGYEFFKDAYDTGARGIVLKTGRQVSKSTTIANKLVLLAATIPHFSSLYVAPTENHISVFSKQKLSGVLASPFIKKHFFSVEKTSQVFYKQLSNFSDIILRSCFLDPEGIRGIASDMICFDKDTQVLTKDGWKQVSDLSSEDDVADVNDSGVVEWNKPTKVFNKLYTGEMITFNHRNLKLRVTSDHNTWVNFKVKAGKGYKNKDLWEFKKAGELYRDTSMGFKMTCGADWNDSRPKEKIFPPWQVTQRINNKYGETGKIRTNIYPGLSIKYTSLAKLLGWYLSEGNLTRGQSKKPNGICITQKPSRYLDEIIGIVTETGLPFSVHISKESGCASVRISSSLLARYLAPLGNSYHKYIPREFFDSPELLALILEGIYKGDACHHKGEHWTNATLRTRSKKLAETVQEAWLRLKKPAVIHTRMHVPRHQDHPEFLTTPKVPMYEVCAQKREYFIFWNHEKVKKNRITSEQVTDETVYCFTVKNHRPIVKGDFKSVPIITSQCIDELQDILTENISVIQECYTRSDHKFSIYAGTPKTNQHATEYYWDLSTKNEWLVKCRHCNFWNYLDEKCVQPNGLSCSKCHKRINAQDDGEWVSFDTTQKNRLAGYRVSQLMVNWIPWNLDEAIRMYGETADESGTIMYKYQKYNRMRFFNEVLGLPYDNAACPITIRDLIEACDPELAVAENLSDSSVLAKMVMYAGIDWSTSVESASYTVLTIGGFVPGNKFVVVYSKRYEGIESDLMPMLKHIVQKLRDFNVRVVGCDWGSGADKNSMLANTIKSEGRQLIEFNHSGTQKADINWNARAKIFIVNRTRIMTEIFNKIKYKEIVFPRWMEMQNYLSDLLNIYTDYNEVLRSIFFNHPPDKPDDYMHSLCFCYLVATSASQ